MTINKWRTGFLGLCATLTLVLFMAVVATAQTKTMTSTKGTPEVRTLKLNGTVVAQDGTTLLVKMSTGEYRAFAPPANRKFVIDGKEMGLSDLQAGTKLNATYTETETPVTTRTVETIEGTVWYAKGPTVILTLPSGENKQYVVKHDDPVKFYDHDNKEITVFDMKKGMMIHATKITEAPAVELSSTADVTGTAPAMAQAPAAAAPAGETPKALPHTSSPVPFVGLLGLLFTSTSYVIRRFRR